MTESSGRGGAHRGMIPDTLICWFVQLLSPLVFILGRTGVHPNYLTTLGLILNGCAAALIAVGHLGAAGVIVGLAGLCDCLDGEVARKTGKVSAVGARWDYIADRLSECILLAAVIGLFLVKGHLILVLSTTAALFGSLLTSHMRKIGHKWSIDAQHGPLRRQDRVVLLTAALLLSAGTQWMSESVGPQRPLVSTVDISLWPLSAAMLVMCILTPVTATRRALAVCSCSGAERRSQITQSLSTKTRSQKSEPGGAAIPHEQKANAA